MVPLECVALQGQELKAGNCSSAPFEGAMRYDLSSALAGQWWALPLLGDRLCCISRVGKRA